MNLRFDVKFALSVDHHVFRLEIIEGSLSAMYDLEDANELIDDVNGLDCFIKAS